jgi:hypothetical protein
MVLGGVMNTRVGYEWLGVRARVWREYKCRTISATRLSCGVMCIIWPIRTSFAARVKE